MTKTTSCRFQTSKVEKKHHRRHNIPQKNNGNTQTPMQIIPAQP